MNRAADRSAYDYVIVGAGAAGCVLASRLTEDPDVTVLLLEAGGWDRSRWIHIPLGVGRILQKRLFDWGYAVEPQHSLDGRRLSYPRGKIIGGTTSINSMTFVRGHRGDYDRWAAADLPEWSYAHVLPYFRRMETWEGGEDAFRGGGGPLHVRRSRYHDPLVDAYLAAAQSYGYSLTDDYNSTRQEGFSLVQSTIRHGRRVSAATAYLHPVLKRKNLTIQVSALATRVLLEGRRVSAIEFLKAGRPTVVRAEREIVLACGAVNSPQLLMLSGIGSPDDLSAHGIAVQVALPGVGKNLQDHVAASVTYARKGTSPLVHNLRLDRTARALIQAQLFGTGFAADVPSRWLAFIKTQPALPLPDIQLLFRAGPAEAKPYLPPFTAPVPDRFSCRAVMLRPESRGTVALASANPCTAPRIDFAILEAANDMRTLRSALRIVRALGDSASLSPFIAYEFAPGPDQNSDVELDAYMRQTAQLADHAAGTCKMGLDRDPTTVVDPRLRVHGVEGLRVVDASVMPDLVGGNIMACVLMIAEKASDLIRAQA